MIDVAALLLRHKGKLLFVRRSGTGDHGGEWAFPGGHVEPGENTEDAALREAREELGGFDLAGDPAQWTKTYYAPDGVECTSYLAEVKRKFNPKLNDVADEYVWASPALPPEPLHPGARMAVHRFFMTEMQVAREIAEGRLASPEWYRNMLLVAIRITAVGAAYRGETEGKSGKKGRPEEFVWRNPDYYLNDEFLARCNGLPVIWGHPPNSEALTSAEFEKRSIGTVMLPYIRGDEVWGIARIYNDYAIEKIITGEYSTSPDIIFDSTNFIEDEDGKRIHIESDPAFIDHIAIVPVGVWDKEGPATGVDVSAIHERLNMPDDKRRSDADDTDHKRLVDDRLDALEKGMTTGFESISKALKELSENGRNDARDRRDAESEHERREASEGEPRNSRGEFDSRRDRRDHDDRRDFRDRRDEESERERRSVSEDEPRNSRGEWDDRRDRHDRRDHDDHRDRRDRRDAESGYERSEVARSEPRNSRGEFDSRRDRRGHDDRRDRRDEHDEPFLEWARQEMREKAHGGSRDDRHDHRDRRDHDDGRDHEDRRDFSKSAEDMRREIEEMKTRLALVDREIDPDEQDAMADAQRRADAVAAMHGDRASPPRPGEKSLDYRRRLANKLKVHSEKFKATRLDGVPEEALGPIEDIIYADAKNAASKVYENDGIGTIAWQSRSDETGRKITWGVGDPMAWMKEFSTPGQVCSLNVH